MVELASFDEELAKRPMLVVASKMDVAHDPKKLTALRRLAKKHDMPFFEISSVTGKGIDALTFALAERVLPPANG
jgi:GTP-binding protein